MLSHIERSIRQERIISDPANVTVREYGERWLRQRKALRIDDSTNDESRLRCHVYKRIGTMRLLDVRAIHIAAVIRSLRLSPPLKAPRTIRNIYSVLRAFFRDAEIEGLVDRSPCILTRYQLGEVADADPDWRDQAIFTRDELTALAR